MVDNWNFKASIISKLYRYILKIHRCIYTGPIFCVNCTILKKNHSKAFNQIIRENSNLSGHEL